MKRATVAKAKVAKGGARHCMLRYEGVTKYANCMSRCMKCKNPVVSLRLSVTDVLLVIFFMTSWAA